MSRIRARELFADPVTGATSYLWFVGPPGDVEFLPGADAGLIAPYRETATPVLRLDQDSGLADGRYQFALIAANQALGSFSDPYQHPAWADLPLALTPLAAPTNGGVRFAA